MMESQLSERRSERKRRRKESYSPDGKKEEGEKKRKGPRAQGKVNRLFDLLPNGEQFSCHMCTSPYVVNPMTKGVKKGGRSRHTPLPKLRTDKATGKEVMLCNACVTIYDRPQRRAAKPVSVPSEEEKKAYMEQVDRFLNVLKTEVQDPLVEKLFCPLNQKKLCGCLQKYLQTEEGKAKVPTLLQLMKKAVELRKEKCYTITNEKKKVKFVGLGNGHKKSKSYEEFVIVNRRTLKEDLRLCERSTQKILLYSNNFLHKRLKTENRPCRIERTRGKAVLGQLPEFHTMTELNCCTDNCVMMALTHRKLLQDWRDRAQQGQAEARRVMAEMLTPAGATHINCYTFISMVTGCSPSTIARVSRQMLFTGGNREPPEHGMKRVWQEHYKQNKTSEGPTETRSSQLGTRETTPATALPRNSAEVASPPSQAVVTQQQKLAWIQSLADKQLKQQQLLSLQHELLNSKQKHIPAELVQILEQKQFEQLMSQGHILPGKLRGAQGNSLGGQGHLTTGQSSIQPSIFQPPPVYRVDQSNINRQLQQSNFTVSMNQSNYLVTGENQFVPVLPVFQQTDCPNNLLSFNRIQSVCQQVNNNPALFQNNFQMSVPQIRLTGQTVSKPVDSLSNPAIGLSGPSTNVDQNLLLGNTTEQSPVLRQYQIVTDQGVFHIQATDVKAFSENIQNSNTVLSHTPTYSTAHSETSNSIINVNIENSSPSLTYQVLRSSDGGDSGNNQSASVQDIYSLAEKNDGVELLPQARSYCNDVVTDSIQTVKLPSSSLIEPVKLSDSSTNQEPLETQSVNQTQLLVPFDFYPVSSSNNGMSSEQVPTQIQISFQTCDVDSNQPTMTQQIMLPHGNVITLPQMAVSSSSSPGNPSFNNTIGTSSSSQCLPITEYVNRQSTETDVCDSAESVNRHQTEYVNTAENSGKTHQDTHEEQFGDLHVDTGNLKQSNGKKSRNSSGQSERSRKSVLHFSAVPRLEHTDDLNENTSAKVNKPKQRQESGNSDGDRSRKSSGNSLISEISSHASGLTWSNFPSPNIFLDKDKGIFFIQTMDGLEFTEIDNNHVTEYMQSLETCQNGTVSEKNLSQSITDAHLIQDDIQSVYSEQYSINQSKEGNICVQLQMTELRNEDELSETVESNQHIRKVEQPAHEIDRHNCKQHQLGHNEQNGEECRQLVSSGQNSSSGQLKQPYPDSTKSKKTNKQNVVKPSPILPYASCVQAASAKGFVPIAPKHSHSTRAMESPVVIKNCKTVRVKTAQNVRVIESSVALKCSQNLRVIESPVNLKCSQNLQVKDSLNMKIIEAPVTLKKTLNSGVIEGPSAAQSVHKLRVSEAPVAAKSLQNVGIIQSAPVQNNIQNTTPVLCSLLSKRPSYPMKSDLG